MIRRTLLLLLVAGLALGAPAGSVAFAGSSDDQDIADDSILTEDDVADYGLEETASDDEDRLPPNVPACKKLRALDKAADRLPNAESTFSDSAGTGATSKVIVFKNERAARAPIAALASDQGSDCLSADLDQSFSENFTDYQFDGEAVEVDLGDSSIVYQITATVTDDEGTESELYVELGFIQVGRGLAQLVFQAPDAPFDGSEDLATIVVDNLTSNLES